MTGVRAKVLSAATEVLAANGYLYVTANQLHRQARCQCGRDLLRVKPYSLLRVTVDAAPVSLR